MTDRLYYGDSFLREFEARVLSCEAEGDRWKVRLDRTAFYPTSGGQPHDLGTLAGARVVEVADSEDGSVVHYLSAAVLEGQAHGKIDWPRRFDHMQQHTGQHLLSAVFIELFGFQTVSFHLGREISTIDLDVPSIVQGQLDEAERRVNELIFEDRIVAIRYGTAEELAAAGIRKQVDREGVLRAVEIEGIDRQPCGGTHLERTGQAGMILLRKLEKRRNAWRLEFVCGRRALAAARMDYGILTKTATLISCGVSDVPDVISKALEERRDLHGSVKRLEMRLAGHEALSLLNGASPMERAGWQNARLVVAALDDASPAYLTQLAARIAAEAEVVALLGAKASGHLVFAQTKSFPANMGELLREIFREFKGKGGGGKDFAQGALANVSDLGAALERAKSSLRLP